MQSLPSVSPIPLLPAFPAEAVVLAPNANGASDAFLALLDGLLGECTTAVEWESAPAKPDGAREREPEPEPKENELIPLPPIPAPVIPLPAMPAVVAFVGVPLPEAVDVRTESAEALTEGVTEWVRETPVSEIPMPPPASSDPALTLRQPEKQVETAYGAEEPGATTLPEAGTPVGEGAAAGQAASMMATVPALPPMPQGEPPPAPVASPIDNPLVIQRMRIPAESNSRAENAATKEVKPGAKPVTAPVALAGRIEPLRAPEPERQWLPAEWVSRHAMAAGQRGDPAPTAEATPEREVPASTAGEDPAASPTEPGNAQPRVPAVEMKEPAARDGGEAATPDRNSDRERGEKPLPKSSSEAGQREAPEFRPQERAAQAPHRECAGSPAVAVTAPQGDPPVLRPAGERAPVAAPLVELVSEPQTPLRAEPVVRDLILEVPAAQPGSSPVSIELTERGGEVQIAVRTHDARLSDAIADRLPELVQGLERSGFALEVGKPAESGSTGSGTDRERDARQWTGQDSGQRQGGGQRQEQGRPRERWREELADSLFGIPPQQQQQEPTEGALQR